MKSVGIILVFWILAGLVFTGCVREEESIELKIALSKGSPENSYANYYNWVKSLDSNAVSLDMYDMPLDSALALFKGCDGLIITGGTDINPAWYDQEEDSLRCMTIDHYRDTLEMRLIDSALAWKMPILGICRGHQMLNVYFGGSLIIDLPSDYDTLVSHRCPDFNTCFHPVTLADGSLIAELAGQTAGTVNSNHHQGIKNLAPALKIVAFTEDSLPEAVEWNEPAGKTFLMGVQWHPERLGNDNPLSKEIGMRFLRECRK